MSSPLAHLHSDLPQEEVRLHPGGMDGTGAGGAVGGELEEGRSGSPAAYALVGEVCHS